MSDDSHFTEQLLEKINELRTQPITSVVNIQNYKKEIVKYFSYKQTLLKEIQNLEKKWTQKSAAVPEIKLEDVLTQIAEDLLNRLYNVQGTKFYAQDQEYLESLISMEIDGCRKCKNFLSQKESPTDVLMSILFKESDLDSGTHIILDSQVRYIGIAHAKVKGTPVTVVVVSDSVKPTKPKPIWEVLLDEMNRIRSNPKCYIKYLPNDKGNQRKLEEVTERLNKMKVLGKFLSNQCLEKACEIRAEKFENDGLKLTYEQLTDFLAEYGDRFLNVTEYIADAKETAKDFIVNMWITQPENIDLLFSRKFNQVGIAMTESQQVVILFCDNIQEKMSSKPISVLSFRRRLHRPVLSEDEVIQIENDFKGFDILNSGWIRPSSVLLFMSKDKDFQEKNPIYYEAMRWWNTEENNSNGVNSDEFINGVRTVMREYNSNVESYYKDVFQLYFKNKKSKKVIDKDILVSAISEMGFKVNEEDITDWVDKMDGELNEKMFLKIINYIEHRFIPVNPKKVKN